MPKDQLPTLDIDKLDAYLSEAIPGFMGPIQASKFPGGQSNPTYRLKTPSRDYVLRRKPMGDLLKSAHAVDREYRVLQALAATDVPVAAVYALCEDDAVIGAMFYIMEFVDGDVFWDAALPEKNPQQRGAMYEAMSSLLADLHSIDVAPINLSDYGRPGNYFERQISRWTKQYRASETERIDAMDRLLVWLPEHLPEDDGQTCLVHGDFRLDNIMFEPGQQTVKALMDWELSTLGHPYADLSYQCMQLRLPPDCALPGLGGVDRSALGIPSEAAYVAAYCQRRGIDRIPHWNVYLIFNLVRLAAILQGVKKRSLDGNASSDRANEMAKLIAPLADMAAELANL